MTAARSPGSVPLVLGIETSCDETGVGIVAGNRLLADAVASSVSEHARFGGVVPEVASRAHLEALVPTVHRALADAGVQARHLDAVAVTAGPGLPGALMVGVAAASSTVAPSGRMSAVTSAMSSSEECPPETSRATQGAGSAPCATVSTATWAAR